MEFQRCERGQRVKHRDQEILGTVRGRNVQGMLAGTVRVLWDSRVTENVTAEELVLVGPERVG